MKLYEIFSCSGGILFVLLTIIQIVPIKVNPWSWIGKTIGRGINQEVIEKVNSIENKVSELQTKQEAMEYQTQKEDADRCRSRILRFADELRRGEEHSEEFFNQILEDITKYENYCSSHPEYKNKKAVNAIEKINKIHKKCMDENLFL